MRLLVHSALAVDTEAIYAIGGQVKIRAHLSCGIQADLYFGWSCMAKTRFPGIGITPIVRAQLKRL